MIKLLLLITLAVACYGWRTAKCDMCFEPGTYKCKFGSPHDRCDCQVGFTGPRCSDQIRHCDSSQCENGGDCGFKQGQFHCTCPEGFFGRKCEQRESTYSHLKEADVLLGEEKCAEMGQEKGCEPAHLKIVCDQNTLDNCDEHGNVKPYKKCPYPWHCASVFKDGKCNPECERSECLYDGFDCVGEEYCPAKCKLQGGVCDRVCAGNADKHYDWVTEQFMLDDNYTTMQFNLDVTEKFFWENKAEILANISAPLRAPLVYMAERNLDLEPSRKKYDPVYLNRVTRSRRTRRSTDSSAGSISVNLSLSRRMCPRDVQCVRDASTAEQHLSLLPMNPLVSCFGNCPRAVAPSSSTGSSVLAGNAAYRA